MTTPLAQDPDELFDVVTSEGAPTGITKRRADVHRDGDWHRAIHVWVYGVDAAGPYLLMNQRGRHKDTMPLALDATVGGHLGAGESIADAYREIEEEIGIDADPARLRHVGTRARSAEHTTTGVIDRELQEVFLYRDDRPLTDFCPNPAELEALVQIRLTDALRLFAGDVASVPACILSARDRRLRNGADTAGMPVPAAVDRYFLRVAVAIDLLLRGERYVVV